ncbi:hypothetical protein BUALT_Bualt15G0129900 [Buddleja alternifolia]|uniref:Uncharacterized protein n=1 Tax=Buddleja alternifolia TaxID=168488 RepID=A0AAV6WK14_9LAMI|nr:hypothetical protein BUALT_Bualt15G0129900 [Buddleja alternifolia]
MDEAVRMKEAEISKANKEKKDAGPTDNHQLHHPHHDALVITTTKVDDDISSVFIDSGSSMDVIFCAVLQYMDLGDVKMELVDTTPFGFTAMDLHGDRPSGNPGDEDKEVIAIKGKREEMHVQAKANPVEELITVELVTGDPSKVARVGSQLKLELEPCLTQLLREDVDIFS